MHVPFAGLAAGMEDRDATVRQPVDAGAVAQLPAPGSVVPAAFGFTPDGKGLTYLKSESTSLSRVLWRLNLADPTAKPGVVARPPGQGDTEANLSEAEKLRRERQRLRETGLTQVVRAEKVDLAIFPIGGDLYLQRGESPLERLTQTESPEIDPQLTRDGSKVAFVRDSELFVLDLESRAETQLTRGATEGVSHGLAEFMAQEEMDRSSGFWWAPDGKHVAYQETDERPIPLYSIVHQGGEKISVETHRYPFAGAKNASVRLGVVPSGGGTTRWLDFKEEGATEPYLARVHWANPNSLLVQVLDREQINLRLYRFDINTGDRTLLLVDTSKSWINLHNDLRTLETGEFVWSSEETGFRHLYLHNAAGKHVRTLTSGEWPVDSLVRVDEKRREAWFQAGGDSPLEAQLYRVSLDKGEPVQVTHDSGVHRVVVASDGNTFVDVFSTLQHPPVTTVRDRNGKTLYAIDDAASDPRLKTLNLNPPELVEFTNRDGVKLHGAYYAPKSRALGPKAPLVVLVYGGPHVQTVTNAWNLTADMTAQFLTERGFAVWKADNRGSARRGLAFESAIHRRMGSVEVLDQVDGVRFAGGRWAHLDLERVGVSGSSYGGYMTLKCLSAAPEVFHAGVSIAPVTDWDGYDTCYTERYMGTPRNNEAGYQESSALPHVGSMKGALMVIHGMLDENVHFRHTARLTTALITGSKPFSLLPLPDERHSSRREQDRAYVAERVVRFFEQSLQSR